MQPTMASVFFFSYTMLIFIAVIFFLMSHCLFLDLALPIFITASMCPSETFYTGNVARKLEGVALVQTVFFATHLWQGRRWQL